MKNKYVLNLEDIPVKNDILTIEKLNKILF